VILSFTTVGRDPVDPHLRGFMEISGKEGRNNWFRARRRKEL